MVDEHYITRRSFLAGGVVAGVGVSLSAGCWAASSVSMHSVAIGNWVAKGRIGSVANIQFHCAEHFGLETAVKTVEYVCRERGLEKVSACGDWEFAKIPENVMASLYFSDGLRASISSAGSTSGSYGAIMGDKGSIVLQDAGIYLLDVRGNVLDSIPVLPEIFSEESVAYPMILRALRKGTTVYP